MRTLDLATADPQAVQSVLSRSAVPLADTRRDAAAIVDTVRRGGDTALADASRRYGGALADGSTGITSEAMKNAWEGLDAPLRTALETAAENIRIAHEPQRPVDQPLEVRPGVRVDRRWAPLRRVGVYVPGGRASYPSSLLMGVIPAQVAGVAEVVVTSPADGDGVVAPVLLAAAHMLGIVEMHAVGGAQAVAALAYGTESIRRVDKIVGPGNAWVTAAKLAVYGDCAVDLPAGPSEALVLADGHADPRIVAADMLCQAEHGPDSPVVLVVTEPAVAADIIAGINELLPRLGRAEIVRSALGGHGLVVTAPDHDTAVAFANDYAAEHVSIHTRDADEVADLLTSAGSVFVGHWSPESAGDYATGANHVLPTGGLAAAYGPLSVDDFGAWRQVQQLTEAGLAALRPTIVALAEAEGLTAHRLAVDIRFRDDPLPSSTAPTNGRSA